MADPVIPKEALEEAAQGICGRLDLTDVCEEPCERCKKYARAAILAYHADLARRGLKVVGPKATRAMIDAHQIEHGLERLTDEAWEKYFGEGGEGSASAESFRAMWDAAESVL